MNIQSKSFIIYSSTPFFQYGEREFLAEHWAHRERLGYTVGVTRLPRTYPARTSRSRATPRRLRHERRSIEFDNQAPFRMVVVADTHSLPHPKAKEHISAFAPNVLLHAGDIGDLSVLDELAKHAPLHVVRGNIDAHASDLPDALTLNFTNENNTLLTLLMLHIAVAGPRLRGDAISLAVEESASMIVCGHSHVPFISQERGFVVFNPGSVGPRRFPLPILFGLIEIVDGKMAMHHIDCETGQRWSPPLPMGIIAFPNGNAAAGRPRRGFAEGAPCSQGRLLAAMA
jgi:uncharacterized protein